jgi:hypothetical protein
VVRGRGGEGGLGVSSSYLVLSYCRSTRTVDHCPPHVGEAGQELPTSTGRGKSN